MPAARKTALMVLPLLVVAWVAFAVPGSGVHEPGCDTIAGEAVEAGTGICLAGAALLTGLGFRRALTRRFSPSSRFPVPVLRCEKRPTAYLRPPSSGVPRLSLLQIIRV